jgi:hypothetical protein
MTMQEAEGARVTIGELLKRIALADRLAEAVEKAGTYNRTIGVDKALAAYRSPKKEREQDEEV